MMTTIDVASATRGPRLAAIACCVVVALGLTGCGTGANNLLSLDSGVPEGNLADSTSLANPQNASLATSQTRVTIAPVIGAPENVATQLTSALTQSLAGKGVTAVDSGQSEYTLRGYVVAARERTGTKVSYIWDVTDPKGKRVHRITGEEVITGSQSSDPWAAVSQDVVNAIVAKTSNEIGTWLPTQTPSTSAATPAVARSGSSAGTQVASVGNTTTGSLPAAMLVSAPRVTGAPGDGSSSLSSALKKALSDGGATVTSTPNPRAFNVAGKVDVGSPSAGKQPIQIDWTVTDANGTNLGTVTQKNQIPAGSLDGAWGQTADAAASAAAQGILRLIKQSATN